MKECTVINIELSGTLDDLHTQKELFSEYVNPIFGDALILVKHTPLYTYDNPKNMSKIIDCELTLQSGLKNIGSKQLFNNTSSATQLSIFPAIANIEGNENEVDPMNHMIARTIAVYGIKAESKFAKGVLVGGKNISMLYFDNTFSEEGLGLTLNVNTDLADIKKIKSTNVGFQSMKNILGYEIEMEDILDLIIINFGKVFNYKMTLPKSYSQLM